MKLKKIASLMLAGVMAISMLAGCSGNNTDDGASSGDTTPSSSYTETVLKATNAATQTKLSASTNDKLDKAVAWAAQMDRATDLGTKQTLTNIDNSNWDIVKNAQKYMTGTGLQAYSPDTTWNFNASTWSNASFPSTYWTMYYVSATASDEYITNEVAEKLDNWAKKMENKGEVVNNYTYDYTVSVSKADCAGKDLASKNDDYVLVGVAVTTTRTENKY